MYMTHEASRPTTPTGRLAPHETLELHELLAMCATGLLRLKKLLPTISCPELKQLYLHAIRQTEAHIAELMQLLQYRAIIS